MRSPTIITATFPEHLDLQEEMLEPNLDQNELFSVTVAGTQTFISRVSSLSPVVMAMAMVLLEMSIILVYGMRFFLQT